MLKNGEAGWVSDPTELEMLAIDYYKRLYSLDDVEHMVERLPREGFARLEQDDLLSLNRPFTRMEVEMAIRSMGKFKSPGLDGVQPLFYQDCWEVVGDSVVRFMLQFLESGVLPKDIDDALIVLIPKVTKPEMITQFRPISLCNVLFKTITKTLVGRLKKVITKLIGPA